MIINIIAIISIFLSLFCFKSLIVSYIFENDRFFGINVQVIGNIDTSLKNIFYEIYFRMRLLILYKKIIDREFIFWQTKYVYALTADVHNISRSVRISNIKNFYQIKNILEEDKLIKSIFFYYRNLDSNKLHITLYY